MATQRPERTYPASMAVMYATCRLIWQSYLENVAAFTAFLTSYTQAFGEAALAEIDAAEALPEFQARNELTETSFNDLKDAGNSALMRWRYLERYIEHSFAPDDVKALTEAAGKEHYAAAANLNWPELIELLTMGRAFITAHSAALGSGGMPAGFAAGYDTDMAAVTAAYAVFKDSEQDEQEGTDEKVLANNAVYAMTQRLCNDAQLVMWEDAAKRNRFVYSHVQELVSSGGGPNVLTVKGRVTGVAIGLPLEGVKVTAMAEFLEGPVTALTDPDGLYALDVAGGTVGTVVKLNFEHAGYTTGHKSVEYLRGTVKVDVVLVAE